MASFRPAQIMQGMATHATRDGAWRHALVIFQFALLIVLVAVVMVIGRQVSFLLQDNFRVKSDQILYIHAPCSDALKYRIGTLPGTLGVACAAEPLLGLVGAPVVPASLPDGTPFRFNVVGIGPGALELYGLTPLAGRFMPDTRHNGSWGVVINLAAVRGLQLRSPEDRHRQAAARKCRNGAGDHRRCGRLSPALAA